MKKVLIISYYWPPFGGSGVQRWLKFSKYLPDNQWKPIVYTPENPYFQISDTTLLHDISNEVEVWKNPIWEPYKLKDIIFGKGNYSISAGLVSDKNSLKSKLLNWVRGNFFIPDPKVYWVKPSVRFLMNRIKSEGINHIITTGPPHSMHLIGLDIKNKLPNINWVADFRDPWSELDLLDEFYLSKYSRMKHQKLEREVLKNADITLTVSKKWKKDLDRLGAKRTELITNGYDKTDFKVRSKKDDRFIIGHYGLLNHLRNPKNLWRSLNELCMQDKNFASRLEIHLSGEIDRDVLNDIQAYSQLNNKVKELGYLSHTDVLHKYNETDILLLLLFNSKSGIGNYPGKIFEYLAVKKPILAFGPQGSDVENILVDTNSGVYFSYDDLDLSSRILDLYENKQQYKFSNIEQFSRERLTKELSDLLNSI